MSENWIVTIPKTTKWKDYERELEAAENGAVLRYRVPFKPSCEKGDRLYVVWNGRVRGWMEITKVWRAFSPWACETTGRMWPPGWYIERTGQFHKVKGPDMKGFRGLRRYYHEEES